MNIYSMTHKYTGSWGGKRKTRYIVAAESEEKAFELLGWRAKPKKTTAFLLGIDCPFRESTIILKGED